MELGGFYASTGVELKDLILDNNRLSIQVNQETGVTYKIAFIGCKKREDCTRRINVYRWK